MNRRFARYRTKNARLILQSGIYKLLTNISEDTAFLLQGLTYNETLRFENKRIACNMTLCWQVNVKAKTVEIVIDRNLK